MRPNTAVATRIGDLGGEKVAMTFDQNSLAHIMSVLTDLYSDPELAIIREYSTNALDAQIRAGVKKPIEVSTPNTLSPFMVIKDNGVGMNAEDIRNVYSQYGASTKRDSDEFTGMLGLGCKAALTYTNQFMVDAVKDGIRTQVVVSRTEDGSGVMEILSEDETAEENGVKISIPVKQRNSFFRKATEFFKFWDEGTVLLNGAIVERVKGRKLNDNIILCPDAEMDYIVMGNVPYPVDDDHAIHRRTWQSRFGVVARVEIGDISFTPSRENLHYTMKTEATLNKIREEFKTNLRAAAQRDLDAAKDYPEALETFTEWSKILHGHVRQSTELKYKGEEIPVHVNLTGFNFRIHYSRGAVDETTMEHIDNLKNRVVIFGYDNVDIKAHNREKIRGWLKENSISTSNILVVKELPDVFGKWVLDDKTYDWEDVKKFKPKRQSGGVKDEPTYDMMIMMHNHVTYRNVTLSDISDSDLKILVAPAKIKECDDNFMKNVMLAFPDAKVIRTAQTRWDKLKREKKNVVSLEELLEKRYTEVVAALTDDDKTYMMLDYNSRMTLPRMNPDRIKDPELAKLVRVSKLVNESDSIKAYKQIRQLLVQFRYVSDLQLDGIYPAFRKYPMLDSAGYNHEHAIHYVNAIYDNLYS